MPREKNSIANGRRLHTSNFHISINTNHRVRRVEKLSATEQAYYDKFKNFVDTYFEQSPDVILKMLKARDMAANSIQSCGVDMKIELQS